MEHDDLKNLAELAGLKVVGVSMPGRPGGRPMKFYFIKDSSGELLLDGEALAGDELEDFLRTRLVPEEEENNERTRS